MPQKLYESLLEAKTHDEFKCEMVGFSSGLGFDWVSAMIVQDHEWGSDFLTLSNIPSEGHEFRGVVEHGRRDPVMQHCKNSNHPIVWDQATYVQTENGDLWEEQAALGYRTGIALALHLSHGSHFVFGMERHQPLPPEAHELVRLTAHAQLFAMHAQEVVAQILLPSSTEEDKAGLTLDELETLRWTLEGKTPWDIGEALNISESMAVLHISNAVRRLECGTKYQAAIKAHRLGWLA